MGLIKWIEKRIKKMKVWDVGLLKITLLILGMIIGAYISVFIKTHVWYFLGAFIILYLVLLYRFFKL